MKILGPIALLALLVAAMSYYYANDAKQRALRASLNSFSEAVASKDRAKVSAALNELLTDDAKIKLNVHFFSIGGNRPNMVQDFDKQSFISFIDNTLYPLTDYTYTPTLTGLDKDTGTVTFTSNEWADGKDMMGGVGVEMRYGSNSECTGKATFTDTGAKLSEASCDVHFRKVPKPGQAGKINAQGLQQLLQDNR